MATVRRVRSDDSEDAVFKFSPEERERLETMTDEEIERNALEDPDNPPLTDEQLTRMVAGRTVRQVRERTGLSQPMFAERYRINVGRLRDWEQGRFVPDSLALAYLTVIEREPEAVGRALASHNTGSRETKA